VALKFRDIFTHKKLARKMLCILYANYIMYLRNLLLDFPPFSC